MVIRMPGFGQKDIAAQKFRISECDIPLKLTSTVDEN